MKFRHLLVIFTLATASLLAVWGCNDQQSPTGILDEISVSNGAVIQGIVLNINGQPSENAILSLEPLDQGFSAAVTQALESEFQLAAKSGPVRTTVTDPQGRFHFNDLDAGSYLLTSAMRDHAGDSRSLEILPYAAANAETTFVDIQLTPTGNFLGNATLENASDHTGTVVFLAGTSYVAVTNSAGDYHLTGVPVGAWTARAMHPGYLDDSTSGILTTAGDSTALAPLLLKLEANIPPTITSFTASVSPEGSPTFFAWTSSDPDGSISSAEIDFENDGVFDFTTTVVDTTSYTYALQGQYLAKLRVTDDQGGMALAVVTVTVEPPVPTTVYVTPAGNDTNSGSIANPVQTITQGLVLAQTLVVDTVKVTAGTYNEVVSLVEGINLVGGLATGTWTDQPGIYSLITGDPRPVRAQAINAVTTISGFEIVATDAIGPGEASVAVTVVNSDNSLIFVDCRITAGNGSNGSSGSNGPGGSPGGPGQAGQPGDCNQTFVNPGGLGGSGINPGGSGGAGGNQFGNGNNGGAGTNGQGPASGLGGSGGLTDNPGHPGSNGTNGATGAEGIGGTTAATAGSIVGDQWIASTGGGGSDGNHGSGGGGGGGGGGQEGTFIVEGVGNSGGGGGAGGSGGLGGSGGSSGGASFGILALNASPVISGCVITSGLGGSGGFGGLGGSGGAGGSGGNGAASCLSEVGFGGNGGAGGNGGNAGGGAGGHGGPSYTIWQQGGALNLSGSTFNVGTGGAGGSGGSPNGQSGLVGATGTIN